MAITGIAKTLSLDGRPFNIVASQIDIANATTPMTERMTGGVIQPNGGTMLEAHMDVRHVAHRAGLPLDVNVHTVTIMASKMPFWAGG